MFNINDIKAKSSKERVRTLKNFRYLLFTLKEKYVREEKGEDFEVTNNEFDESQIKDIMKQIEEMEHFDGWKNFGETWDVVWAGLYIETDSRTRKPLGVYWRPAFHGADRQLIYPIRLAHINRVKRMETTFKDTKAIMELPIPKALEDEVMKNKKGMQREHLERQMVGEMLPGGDVYAKEEAKRQEIMKTVEEQRKANERLKEIAAQQRALDEKQNNEKGLSDNS